MVTPCYPLSVHYCDGRVGTIPHEEALALYGDFDPGFDSDDPKWLAGKGILRITDASGRLVSVRVEKLEVIRLSLVD